MTLDRLTTSRPHDGGEPGSYRLTTKSELVSQYDGFILTVTLELAESSIRDYRYKLNRFVSYCLSKGWTENIQPVQIRSFIANLLVNGSPKSAQDYLKVVKRFYSYLVDEGILKENPAARIKSPRVPEVIIQTFDKEHINNMLMLCDDVTRCGRRNRAMILTLLDTGVRKCELAKMKVKDIDFQQGMITVMGKGSRQRVVGISKPALRAILHYYSNRPGDSDFLWHTEEGKPLTADGIAMIFKVLKARAGFQDVRLSAHTFRHTSGTMSLLNGATEREVQLLLGHRTNRMTQHYTATITSQQVVHRHQQFSPVKGLLK
jgi:integrase/recombinase XerC